MASVSKTNATAILAIRGITAPKKFRAAVTAHIKRMEPASATKDGVVILADLAHARTNAQATACVIMIAEVAPGACACLAREEAIAPLRAARKNALVTAIALKFPLVMETRQLLYVAVMLAGATRTVLRRLARAVFTASAKAINACASPVGLETTAPGAPVPIHALAKTESAMTESASVTRVGQESIAPSLSLPVQTTAATAESAQPQDASAFISMEAKIAASNALRIAVAVVYVNVVSANVRQAGRHQAAPPNPVKTIATDPTMEFVTTVNACVRSHGSAEHAQRRPVPISAAAAENASTANVPATNLLSSTAQRLGNMATKETTVVCLVARTTVRKAPVITKLDNVHVSLGPRAWTAAKPRVSTSAVATEPVQTCKPVAYANQASKAKTVNRHSVSTTVTRRTMVDAWLKSVSVTHSSQAPTALRRNAQPRCQSIQTCGTSQS